MTKDRDGNLALVQAATAHSATDRGIDRRTGERTDGGTNIVTYIGRVTRDKNAEQIAIIS